MQAVILKLRDGYEGYATQYQDNDFNIFHNEQKETAGSHDGLSEDESRSSSVKSRTGPMNVWERSFKKNTRIKEDVYQTVPSQS